MKKDINHNFPGDFEVFLITPMSKCAKHGSQTYEKAVVEEAETEVDT